VAPERRADAQRNRDAVLAAAQRVVERDGAAALRIGDVAKAAGVGAGTIYRGFGSKRDLLLELLDERERDLQDAVISGPPPLGPGAPPAERLVAFMLALHRLIAGHREILLAADESRPVSRFSQATYAGWRQHTSILLGQLHPGADTNVLADLVLAPLTAALHVHLLDERRLDPELLAAEVARYARMLAIGLDAA
jgi:AcrR family transcriptional regulator